MRQNSIAAIKALGQAMGLASLEPKELRSFPLVTPLITAVLDYSPELDCLLIQAIVGSVGAKSDPAVPGLLLTANAYGQGTGDAWFAAVDDYLLLLSRFWLGTKEGFMLLAELNTFINTAAAWKEALDKGLPGPDPARTPKNFLPAFA
jgi:hypothetical protein